MSIERQWYLIPFNPEPWTTPPYSAGRKNGKLFVNAGRNEHSENFKQSVRESLLAQGATMVTGKIHNVHFLWWRQLVQYEDSAGRRRTKNAVDTTNCQKLAEDALQGVLIDNDRENRFVSSQFIGQAKSSEYGFFVVMIESYGDADGMIDLPEMWIPEGFDRDEILFKVSVEMVNRKLGPTVQPNAVKPPANVWPPVN